MMIEMQKATEAARLRGESFNLCDVVIGGADHREAGFDHVIDRINAGGCAERQRGDLGHIVDPAREAVLNIRARFFASFGNMHRADESPAGTLHGLAMLACGVFRNRPIRGERVEGARRGRADREQVQAELAGRDSAGGRDLVGDRHLDPTRVVRGELQARVLQFEPIGFGIHRLTIQQADQRLNRFFHAIANARGRDCLHVGIGRQRARPDAKYHPPAGHVVELANAIGEDVGMMIRQRRHAGAELDAPRALRDCGNKQLRARHNFPAARMMLANPGFVVVELIRPFDELHVMFEGENRILVRGRMGRNEGAKTKSRMRHGGLLG